MEKCFEEKEAVKYVARFGEEGAIEKLSKLAAKSKQARVILEIITTGLDAEQPQKQNVPEEPDKRRPVIPDNEIRYATKMVWTPKQRMEQILQATGLSFDTPIDESWNPIVSIQWKRGRAELNGKRVIFGKEHLGFMKKNILHKSFESIEMHIVDANDRGIVAVPDIDQFFTRQRRELQKQKRERQAREDARIFEASVILRKYNGRIQGIKIVSSTVRKRIVIPQRFIDTLKEELGTWMFMPLAEKQDCIIAEPVTKMEEGTRTSDSRLDELISNGKVNL